MPSPVFADNGRDSTSYAPFALQDCRATKWQDVRLLFDDWAWLHHHYGTDTIDGYYLNGYGVEGLVKVALFVADLDPDAENIAYNSEGDTCVIHFKQVDMAIRAAELASAMIRQAERLAEMIAVGREQGFED